MCHRLQCKRGALTKCRRCCEA